MPRLSKIGAAALGAFGWTSGSSISATYLQVAGGGGGGCTGSGGGAGGGGAGGLLTGTVSLNPTLSYTVTVGAGGAGKGGADGNGTQGSTSQFGTLTASVGGGYGGLTTGGSGGSGGGGANNSYAGGSATSGQGYAGGTGGPYSGNYTGGGGGGAGAVGGNGASSVAGNGGSGYTASAALGGGTYAGGGGGGTYNGGTRGTGGSGGGGNGDAGNSNNATSGTANLGGGGGGGGYGSTYETAGNGGSGVVIISYLGAQQFGGGVVTSSGGYTIHTFNTSGTLAPLSSLTASALIVAGGGGGGAYTASGYVAGTSGANSSFSIYSTASVGGGGGKVYPGSNSSVGAGGSGGGGTGYSSPQSNPLLVGGSGTSGQGNAGGSGQFGGGSGFWGGGGGGAGAVGANASSTNGNGGVGLTSSISGTSTYYAGGGGGGSWSSSGGSAGTGGLGGGGNGGFSSAGAAGTTNTGGGGGGGDNGSGSGNGGGGAGGLQSITGQTIDTNSTYLVTIGAGGAGSAYGGAGGSGVVIISYPGSTQSMAGGTVTISGGNVIHTFTSSGYLTPLKLVNNSLRFRSSVNGYLNRTPTTSNGTIWTYSAWVKLGAISTASSLYYAYSSGTDFTNLAMNSDGTINFYTSVSGTAKINVKTTAVYRDPAAWYHLVVVYNGTAGSLAFNIYINGVNQALTVTTAQATAKSYIGNNVAQYISNNFNQSAAFDGYLSEVNFIDGQALTPYSFGSYNSYGVWQPITYGGSYGTNGFYLPFTNTTSTTTLGYDFSPAGNNWTPNNISLTSGSTYDSMTDVPTLTSATAANYATLNPLNCGAGGLTNGNLQNNGSGWSSSTTTIAFPATGNFYCEMTGISVAGASQGTSVGILNPEYNLIGYTDAIGNQPKGYGWYSYGGSTYNNSSSTSYNGGATYTTGTVIGIQLNNGVLTFYKNGTSQGTAYSGITGNYCFAVSCYGTDKVALNCGQQPFVYGLPSGAVALNTYNI